MKKLRLLTGTSQRAYLLMSALLAALIVGGLWISITKVFPRPPKSITFAAGLKGGAFDDLVQRYAERMKKQGISVRLVYTSGMAENLALLGNEDSNVDVSIVFGGLASQQEREKLISLGRVSVFPIWFFYRKDVGADGIASFRGRRIAIGPASRSFIEPLLARYGVNEQNARFVYVAGSAAAVALQRGDVDVAPLPFEIGSPAVQTLLHDPGIAFVNMGEAAAIARLFPYFAPVVLPRGVLDLVNVRPTEDVPLIGITNAFVAKKNLHPEIVFRLARVLADEHGTPGLFQRAGEFPTQTDPEFPFADSALDFYRNGVPALNAYLPFWVQFYAKQLAAFAIVLLGIAWPAWRILSGSYETLIDHKLKSLAAMVDASISTVGAATTLDDIERIEKDLIERLDAVARIPIHYRYSALFVSLMIRVDALQTKIAEARDMSGR